MKRLLMLLVAALVAWPTFAQFTADRPGASTGPSVVNRGVFQWEQGMQYDGDGYEGQSGVFQFLSHGESFFEGDVGGVSPG